MVGGIEFETEGFVCCLYFCEFAKQRKGDGVVANCEKASEIKRNHDDLFNILAYTVFGPLG